MYNANDLQLQPDWFSSSELLIPARLEDHLRPLANHYQSDKKRIMAHFFFESYAEVVTDLGVRSLVSSGSALNLRLDRVLFQSNAKGFPIEAKAVAPHLRIEGDRETDSFAFVTALLTEHLYPVAQRLSEVSGAPYRALRQFVLDGFARSIATLADAGQLSSPKVMLQGLLLHTGVSERAWPRLLAPGEQGASEWFVQRCSCCLSYRLPDKDHCGSCPRLPLEVRLS